MGDYDWQNPQVVEYAVDGIRAEATRWYAFSNQLGNILSAIKNLNLDRGAFLVPDITSGFTVATDQQAAYNTMHDCVIRIFETGVTELDRMGDILKKCADQYDATEGKGVQDFDTIAQQ